AAADRGQAAWDRRREGAQAMSEEENKDVVEETPQDEGASAAGPVEGEEPSSSQAAGEDPTPTPPAEEAPEAEAPQDEASEDSADAAESEQGEVAGASDEVAEQADQGGQGAGAPADGSGSEAEQSSVDDDLPWKERRRLERSRRPHEAGPEL